MQFLPQKGHSLQNKTVQVCIRTNQIIKLLSVGVYVWASMCDAALLNSKDIINYYSYIRDYN